MWIPTDSLTVLYGVNSEYQIFSYDRLGTVRRIVRKDHEPRAIGDRDIRAFFVYLDNAWIANGVSPAQLARNHDRVSFAEYFRPSRRCGSGRRDRSGCSRFNHRPT